MKIKRIFRILKNILKNTHTDKILYAYLAFVAVSALLILIFEPGIHRYADALWYCYSVLSTTGFGDVVVTTPLPRILSVLVTVFTILITAIVTGVIVNYYMQIVALRNKETLAAFMDKLERLPDLSEEELKELSENVKRFRETGKTKND